METKTIIVQKLRREEIDIYAYAQKYYSILSAVNDLALTEREIQLIAFTAVNGNISYTAVKKEFCEKYKSSSPTVNNIVSKLKRIGIFVKDGTKVKINPVICLDFNKEIQLEVKLTTKDV